MIICIGAGPGDIGYLTQRGAELIKDAEVVAGFDAVVKVVQSIIPTTANVVLMNYRDQTEQLATVAAAHHAGKRCVVVFMGDIHFSGFQYLERVERACGHAVETLPGISSAQILASRSKVCFDETSFSERTKRPAECHRDSLPVGCGAIVYADAYCGLFAGARGGAGSSYRSLGKFNGCRSGVARVTG
jgi:precorrin-6B methylase 1